ncbi:hypothetical protein VIGAN_02048500 [Vigna angularis var. angularis]|uniref:Uncharacterized protein n=1 Tax=Vigna angularis var. angularis TaxID=157739 RepID=A0A0S3RB80_PHAAN|nr:hypothetical protein VIGAN_02048500 [Vigna angularis var. angularis]
MGWWRKQVVVVEGVTPISKSIRSRSGTSCRLWWCNQLHIPIEPIFTTASHPLRRATLIRHHNREALATATLSRFQSRHRNPPSRTNLPPRLLPSPPELRDG